MLVDRTDHYREMALSHAGVIARLDPAIEHCLAVCPTVISTFASFAASVAAILAIASTTAMKIGMAIVVVCYLSRALLPQCSHQHRRVVILARLEQPPPTVISVAVGFFRVTAVGFVRVTTVTLHLGR